MNKMELLAPAGNMDALKAAVQNGADAVYLGTGAFNARRHAGNFEGDDLKRAVDYCHIRGVQVHVTLNTMVRQDELDALYETIRQINVSGADAVIVQDFGAIRALRQIAPTLHLHASTQMAAHNLQAVRFLKTQGFDRVVLAREASIEDIQQCAAEGIEIETFVHGALCVACSGQCLMSSLVGGRSGNRGLCAQPCRLSWRLEDNEGYMLSTRDLCAIDDLEKLHRAGVSSLKIEGRLKRPEYVAVTVAAYRKALDALYEGEKWDAEASKRELRQMFNRGGFTRGYAYGLKERELMYSERPNHLGVEVGKCAKSGSIDLTEAVEAADVLSLRRLSEDIPVQLSGGAGERAICKAAKAGDRLIRLVCDAQMRRARESFSGEHRQKDVTARAVLKVGTPASLSISDGKYDAFAQGDVLQRAAARGFDEERTRQQLQKTGGTPWRVTDIAIDADEDAFVPVSVLNALRREALKQLENHYTRVDRINGSPKAPVIEKCSDAETKLYVQSSDPVLLQRSLSLGADIAVLCPDNLFSLDIEALPERFALAVPAVLTGEALKRLNQWAMDNVSRISETFISNIGHMGLKWPGRLSGDYMLNIANDISTTQLSQWGIETITPSVELNAQQISNMGGSMNLILWGRLPLMHLRHCPLRAAYDLKGCHADCRRCDACKPEEHINQKALIDRKNAAFPLHRIFMPGGCVVQVLNSVPLMPLRRLNKLPKASGWRLLLQSDEPLEAVIKVYRAALNGEDFHTLPEWTTITAMNTTTGHYFRGVD